MSINSYKEDEQLSGRSKTQTLLRLLSYLTAYKKEIVFVLLIHCLILHLKLNYIPLVTFL